MILFTVQYIVIIIIIITRLNIDAGEGFFVFVSIVFLGIAGMFLFNFSLNFFSVLLFSARFYRIGDIDGDGYGDLVCKSSDALGQIIILQNKPGEYFTDQSLRKELRFCGNAGPKQFYVADMSVDKLSDLLCQSTKGKRTVYFSKCSF